MADHSLIHEEKDNIRVDISFEGALLVSSTIPWPVDYYIDNVEAEVARVSDNIIHLALCKIEQRFPEVFARLVSLLENPSVSDMLKYNIVILRHMWGTHYDNIYGPVDVDIL